MSGAIPPLLSFNVCWESRVCAGVGLCVLPAANLLHAPGQAPAEGEPCRTARGCPWQREFVFLVENRVEVPLSFQDTVYFTVCKTKNKKHSQLRCSGRFSVWVCFKLCSTFSLSYFSCHFARLRESNDIHHSCPGVMALRGARMYGRFRLQRGDRLY